MITLDEMKRANRNAGLHWFDPDTLRFFGSKIYEDTITECPNGALFVSSEKPPYDVRMYSIRRFNSETGQVETYGADFASIATKRQAVKILKAEVQRLYDI